MLTVTDQMRSLVAAVSATDCHDDDTVLHTYASAAWTSLTEPGDGFAGALRQEFGAVGALQMVLDGDAEGLATSVEGEDRSQAEAAMSRWVPRLDFERFDRVLEDAAKHQQLLIVPGSAHWPAQLDDLAFGAPAALWLRGNLDALRASASGVAIVGARAATAYGTQVAGDLVSAAVAKGLVVVSGGAFGIDAASHRTAMAAGGRTVAVMPGGLDRYYPVAHYDMLRSVERLGVVVSEVPSGTAPTRWRFLQRNRIIAALAAGTVVVEAATRSGSINTAKHASDLGRPLGAVPGPVTSHANAGCHRIIREMGGDIIESGDDLLRLVGAGDSAS